MDDRMFEAVTLDESKCKGCINCIKRCPTEAIRVRDGKARISYERCVSCGKCIRTCPNNAKIANYDPLSILDDSPFKHKVVLMPPSLLGQFTSYASPLLVVNALHLLGFDSVYEVARAADIVSKFTRELLVKSNGKKTYISTACPACVELIQLRFHSLRDNFLPFLPPVEIAAKLAREEAEAKTGLKGSDIGIFFISPCPSKVSAIKTNFYSDDCGIDGVFAAQEVCMKMFSIRPDEVKQKTPLFASNMGTGWAASGGECNSLTNKTNHLAVDGLDSVISVLKELEDGKLSHLEFVELNACHGGCVGGALNIENPFVARSRLFNIRRIHLNKKINKTDKVNRGTDYYSMKSLADIDTLKLDNSFAVAFKMLQRVDEILADLPGLDCGICGAPTCRAFAEDVVKDNTDINFCSLKKK